MSRRHSVNPLLGISAASSMPPAALAVSGAPWWALLVATLPGAVVLVLQAVLRRTPMIAWSGGVTRADTGSSSAAHSRPPPISAIAE
ncbi:hypothetical protein ACFPK5_01075 [Streptomyces beijiangensis]|uniref:hypothetical protein n=1 Tax=Streptomyces beijiangensis TaxID=163361 RepID=UPI003621E2F6